MDALKQTCDTPAQLFRKSKYLSDFRNGLEYIEIFQELLSFKDETEIIENCEWSRNLQNCGMVFQRFLTEEGICYTFNSPHPSEILREESQLEELMFGANENSNNFLWNADENFTNFRILGSGDPGLQLYLNGDSNKNVLCKKRLSGFKVYFFMEHTFYFLK